MAFILIARFCIDSLYKEFFCLTWGIDVKAQGV